MAALTKEQKAQRETGKPGELIAMFTDFEQFPGAPKTADVHPDEVENFKADGWRIAE